MKNMKLTLIAMSLMMSASAFAEDGVVKQDVQAVQQDRKDVKEAKKDIKEARENKRLGPRF